MRKFSSFGRDRINLTLGSLSVDNDYKCLKMSDFEKLTQIYLDRLPTLNVETIPVSPQKAKDVIRNNIYGKNAVGILRLNNEVCGGIIAVKTTYETSDYELLQQTFYVSSLTGIHSIHAIWLAHRFLIEYAKQHEISYVVSSCSTKDIHHKLNKILSLDGWFSEGHTSVKHVEV